MKIVFIVVLLILLWYFKFQLKLSIDLKSFFLKGFKKIDNQFGCFCYCGKQGRGKTYSAIRFCIHRKLKTDCIIITNVRSFNVFDDTIFIDNIYELIEFVINKSDEFEHNKKIAIENDLDFPDSPNIVIFFDEIFTVMTKQSKITDDILSFLSQLRKRNIIFVTTAQEWLEINVTFRRYVRFVVQCQMKSLPVFNSAILINQVQDGEQIKWSQEENDYICPVIQTNIAKGNLAIIESYDTFETVKVSKKRKQQTE